MAITIDLEIADAIGFGYIPELRDDPLCTIVECCTIVEYTTFSNYDLEDIIESIREYLYDDTIKNIIMKKSRMEAREYYICVENYLNCCKDTKNAGSISLVEGECSSFWINELKLISGQKSTYGYYSFMVFDPYLNYYPYFQPKPDETGHMLENLWMRRDSIKT